MPGEVDVGVDGSAIAEAVNGLTGRREGYDAVVFSAGERLRLTCLVGGEPKKKRAHTLWISAQPVLAVSDAGIYFLKSYYNNVITNEAWHRSHIKRGDAWPAKAIYRFSNAHDTLNDEERRSFATVILSAALLDTQRLLKLSHAGFSEELYLEIFDRL